MGCNCKQVKKINDKYKFSKTSNYKQLGFIKIFKWFKQSLWNFLGACLSLIFMTVIMPIILIVLFYNTIFKGKNVIDLSFLKKWLKNKKK